MTRLEQEIRSNITYVGQTSDDLDSDARSIATIALKYIEKAYRAGDEDWRVFRLYAEENGLIEKESPDIETVSPTY